MNRSHEAIPGIGKPMRLLRSPKMLMRRNVMAHSKLEIKQVYKLLQEVLQQNKEKVVQLLRSGVPGLINLTEPNDGIGALHLAALNNYLEMAQLLLSLYAHPDIQNKYGQSAIMMAAKLGHVDMVALLANNQANMTLVDKEGKGILFYCISPTKTHKQIWEIVLNNNINVNNIAYSGRSAFMFACEHGKDCEKLCLQLLERGADPNVADPLSGRTPLMEAVRLGSLTVVREILQRGGNPNVVDKQKLSAAHIAAEGFIEALILLSAYSADFNLVSSLGNTPLHEAAAKGCVQCCRFLIQRGCKLMTRNHQYLLPSQVAELNNHKAAVKELKESEKDLQSGLLSAFFDQARLHDWAFEHEAVLRQAFQSAEKSDACISEETFLSVLKAYYAPIDDDGLQTVADKLIRRSAGDIDIDDFFLDVGYLPNKYHLSSFHHSLTRGARVMDKIVNQSINDTCIIRRGHTLSSILKPKPVYISINDCVKRNDFGSLYIALRQNIPVDIRDHFYKTPLMNACISGNRKMVRYLIAHGANVNTCDDLKWTSLHHACFCGHTEIVQLLLEHGAIVDAITIHKVTPLMRAIQSSKLSCVDLLIKSGANILATNKRGQDCMLLAQMYGSPQIRALVRHTLYQVPEKNVTNRMPKQCQQAMKVNVAFKPGARNYFSTSAFQRDSVKRFLSSSDFKQQMAGRRIYLTDSMMNIRRTGQSHQHSRESLRLSGINSSFPASRMSGVYHH
ncbi:ankyrin repeat and EF-hand domain-containing protein 1-like isoform X2 [Silurus meridionalis]|uniref:ankyrin repeat and EF-hand domain-containing protein 1-like isoform X2 n=1 Tax=Silurus meridionalis TaxID=175797 RepID=UPI001EEAF548|nr:ankyrin repeat and EF-hand domain-containing protein 1-like isoform X2 [Silurus meridionalis]